MDSLEHGTPTRIQSSTTSLSPTPDRILHAGLEWTLIDHAINRRKGSKVSKVWHLGHEYAALAGNRSCWRCSLCSPSNVLLSLSGDSVSNAVRHLRSRHGIEATDRPSLVPSLAANQGSLLQSINVRQFRRSLTRWLVNRQQSFIEVEDRDFQEMLIALNVAIEPYLVKSGGTIKRWVEDDFEGAKDQVRTALQQAQSKVHVTFDLWTSSNGYALCGVVGHYVNPCYQNERCLLALKRVPGTHSRANIADVILPVLRDYDLVDNLGVLVADNATTNDDAVDIIVHATHPDARPAARRGRCLGHIINLAAKAFIFGNNVEAFEVNTSLADNNAAVDTEILTRAQDEWRKKGPVGKLHNVVVFLRASPQRREWWQQCKGNDDKIDGLMPILDNATRWNSTYDSIQRALKLRPRLGLFVYQYSRDLQDDRLTDEDWSHLAEIARALEPFHEATKYLEGHARQAHHGSAWEVIPMLEALLEHCEASRCHESGRRSRPTALEIAHQNAWEKLRKYYRRTDEAHEIYAAALLLHPSHRQLYFDNHWDAEWMTPMLQATKAVWQEHYNRLDAAESCQPPPDKRLKSSLLANYLQKPRARAPAGDRFDSYVRDSPTEFADSGDVFTWLNQTTNVPASVRQYALDLLSIPAMSAEVERVFSSSSSLITQDRNRLHNDTIERLELLKYWWTHNIVTE